MEYLQNIDQMLIIVGFVISAASTVTFFISWHDEQYKALRYALLALGFGMMLFFLGWAVPNPPVPPEPKISEMAPIDRVDMMYNECMQHVHETPENRASCVATIKGKLTLYKQLENEVNVPRALPAPNRQSNPQPVERAR